MAKGSPRSGKRAAVLTLRAKEDRHFITALARGLDVLDCFRSGDRMLGNQDIAMRCRLPKSTVSRLTYTLTKLGYLVFVEENAKYRLGSATLSLGMSMFSRLDLRPLARPLMQQLADSAHATVSLGSRDRLEMLYVDVVRSSMPVTVALDIGSRIPLATTAMGRAYLARCAEDEREEIMRQLRERDRAGWPRIRLGVETALRDYAEIGCASSFGEWQKEVNSIGIAFDPGGGRAPMAMTCGGPAFMLERDFLLEVARPKLIAIGRQIETALGTAPSS